MTLKEMKKKVLGMIEELNPNNEYLTDDQDIQLKINSVINQVMFELARMKKIPASATEEVTIGQVFDMNTLPNFYQLRVIRFEGIFDIFENTAIFYDEGKATFFYYKYPEAITEENAETYEFELSQDALEIMPYGVAGDLLKSDVSTEYGAVYSNRYETMLQRLDPRYSMSSITIEGGVNV